MQGEDHFHLHYPGTETTSQCVQTVIGQLSGRIFLFLAGEFSFLFS
jgi:hypothetical protein